MSDIDNSNFDRSTKLDPATLNQKFQDVQVATTAGLNGDNIRNSGLDVYNFATNATNGRAGFVLKYQKMGSIGSTVGTTFAHESGASGLNGATVGSNFVLFPNVTLKTGDILRVYWTAEVSKNWSAVTNQVHREFWALWLQWNLSTDGAGVYNAVPGQGNFNRNVVGSEYGNDINTTDPAKLSNNNNYACSFVHHVPIIDTGGTAANTTSEPAAFTSAYVNEVNSRQMVSGSYLYTVEAAYNNVSLNNLRLVAGGLLTPYWDTGTSRNYIVVDPTQPAGTLPTLTVYDVSIALIHMEPN